MNSELITRSIYQHLITWEHYDKTKVAIDNINFKTPKDGSLWYWVTVQHGINLMVGMADKPCTRELGAVVIQIFSPANKSTLDAIQKADSLGSHFQYYRTGKLEFMTASVINVPERENGYQINVRIPFRYN